MKTDLKCTCAFCDILYLLCICQAYMHLGCRHSTMEKNVDFGAHLSTGKSGIINPKKVDVSRFKNRETDRFGSGVEK